MTTQTRPALDTLADRVRYLRTCAGLQYCESDRLAGVHRGFTREVEIGARTSPRIRSLEQLANAYGVAPAWLSYGAGKRPSKSLIREHVIAQRLAAMASAAVQS